MDKHTKILLVDDSVFMRNVLKNILTTEGFDTFIEAGNGLEAVDMIQKEGPGLVLLDLIMPEMGGIDVLKKCSGKSKFIVISAVGQEKIIQEATSLGAASYVIKPFDISQVVGEVKKVLSASS